jgi:hypothetical protein
MNATLLAAIIAISVLVSSHNPRANGATVPEGLEPRLEEFFTEKQAQARSLIKLEKKEGTPEMWEFFTAGENGDWATVAQLYPRLRGGGGRKDPRLVTMAWQPIIECFYAYDVTSQMEEKYVTDFAQSVLKSMPRGSIYFGGNDAGRWLPTAFSKSDAKADPVFILSQNLLTDGYYLKYLRTMFEERINLPSEETLQATIQEYLDDAQKRQAENKLKPGEEIGMVDGKLQPRSHIAVMAINAFLAKKIFDTNPDKEFFVVESFPLDWMYPHLTPNGPILKINRKPLIEISDEIVKRDQTYWTRFVNGALDKWLAQTTSVETVCDFARRAFEQKEPAPFKPDDKFVNNAYASRTYSKLRSAVASVYLWRARNTGSVSEKKRMLSAADFAFRQAFAMCPSSAEVTYRYISLLVDQKRFQDARRLAQTAQILDASGGSYPALLNELDRLEEAEKKP